MAAAAVAAPLQSGTELVEAHEESRLPFRLQPAASADRDGGDGSTASSHSFVDIQGADEGIQTETKSRPGLLRSHSALDPGQRKSFDQRPDADTRGRDGDTADQTPEFERHGFESQSEKLKQLSTAELDAFALALQNRLLESFNEAFTLKLTPLETQNYFLYYEQKRHECGGNPTHDRSTDNSEDWRMRDRLKTVSAVLAICLNIGVDPPDVIKTNPCARLECWTDPVTATGLPDSGVMGAIGKNLQSQYEAISIRTRYRLIPDPTNEEMKKYCCTLRRTAKDDRILFHYNGHGVPKPTQSGEIWVFNKGYTQYIPISIYDLQGFLGAPTLFVYDCSDAGLIIQNYNRFAERSEAENAEALRKDPQYQPQPYSDCIHLAACSGGETLPVNPSLPADLFTSCLTTPIEIAVRIFILQNPLEHGLDQDVVKAIPGKSSERRSPIGELNWIFTAITDTIAWNTLDKATFKKLFRQDLMVAALFRNFLLAQRVMRRYGCNPQCYPQIGICYNHPLWDSWDLAVELVLAQVPAFIHAKKTKTEYDYHHSEFFAEQLTAFEVYLDQDAVDGKEPEQLPIVLQVLLSQVHRLRALILLSKFLDLGPWAVKLALGIGIFPYVLKLLQSQAMELKPVMVFIWARIMAVDQTCQTDLLKDNGYQYFVNILNPDSGFPIKIVAEHRAMCAFIIAMFCKDYPPGQNVAKSDDRDVLIKVCLAQASFPGAENPLLRQWSCLCLSMLWKGFPDAIWTGIRCSAHIILCKSIVDPVPEVRAAVLHAFTNFFGIPELTEQISLMEENVASNLLVMSHDGSNLVRKELVIFFSAFVVRYESRYIVTAFEHLQSENSSNPPEAEGRSLPATPPSIDSEEDVNHVSVDSIHSAVWKTLLIMSVDPDPEVSQNARIVIDHVLSMLQKSPLGSQVQSLVGDAIAAAQPPASTGQPLHKENFRPAIPRPPPTPTSPSPEKDGYFSSSMRRTASVAASLRSLAFGSHAPSPEPHRRTPSLTSTRTPGLSRAQSSLELTEEEDCRASELSGPYDMTKVPLPKYFKQKPTRGKVMLPLTSTFFDFSTEYFREPQMKRNENDEPGSMVYNNRLWRQNRNEKILERTQRLKEHAGSSPWEDNIGIINNGVQPMQMCFHQFNNHLSITDEHDTVRIWNWKKRQSLSRYSNGNPPGSKITGSRFINEDDNSILMTGSSEGIIRLWANYEKQDEVFLTSSFRALTDLVPSTHNAGLVFEWLQGRGQTLVAGDAKMIRVWNAEMEMCIRDIPARSGSCVTSLTADQVEGNVLAAGFGDGAVRVYDQREPPATSKVMQWKEHSQWVANVHMQRGGSRELVSGSRDGEIKLWDIRYKGCVRTVKATGGVDGLSSSGSSVRGVVNEKTKPGHGVDGLRTLSVHEHAPVFVAGTQRHSLRVFNTEGVLLSSIQPHATMLANPQRSHSTTSLANPNGTSSPYSYGGAKNMNGKSPASTHKSPISATAFHPHRMMLAAGALGDCRVVLIECAGAIGSKSIIA